MRRNVIYMTSRRVSRGKNSIINQCSRFGEASTMAAVCACLLCRSSLERAINQRRKLHSDSTKHVLTTFREFVGELETSAIEFIFHPKAFLCRPCVRNIEKVQKFTLAS